MQARRTGAPGYVWVTKAEIAVLAAALGLQVEEFERQFVRLVGVRKSLVERANGDCALLDAETWMGAQEAVDQGFADEVLGVGIPGRQRHARAGADLDHCLASGGRSSDLGKNPLHGIGRIGCFAAGCCWGLRTRTSRPALTPA